MFSDHGLPVFKIKFRLSDGKKHPIWRELEELGIECADFYCPHCRQDIAWSPRAIIKHLNPHSGALRVNMEPQVLCMTLSKGRVEDGEFEGLYEAGE